jgi:DNA-binding LytR/AlgR family response regulator
MIQNRREDIVKNMEPDNSHLRISPPGPSCYFFVRTCHKYEVVRKSDILYVKGLKEYLQIVTRTGNIVTLMSFGRLQSLLQDNCFLRVHRSYLINISMVTSISNTCLTIGKDRIPIGISYREGLMSYLSKLNLIV